MQGEIRMSEHRLDEPPAKRPFIPRMVRTFAIPIIFFWGFLAVTTTAFMPKVEDVAEELAGPMIPHYAPSQRALLHIGEKFHESNSTNLTMVVLEANRPLADQDHRYYDDLMRRLQRDTKHVQYVMDLWGKPFTAAGAQSVDGKCAYVLLRLAGDIGQIEANASVNAVRDIVAKDTPPPGLKVYVSGAAPLASDTLSIANASLNNVTIVTIVLIIVMLLLVYRSPPTLLVPLLGVLIEMLVAKGIISTLGHLGYIELSSFAVNIVIALTLGAGTDYGIFLIGRYHEARQAGESREDSFYIAYKGVAPIIIGSGLTIAGACYCLTFARLNYFHTMGPAVAITMLFTIAAAMTLGPAVLTVGSLFGMFDPRQQAKAHLYRRIGASVVRWPVPILVASSAIVMIGAIFVPSYRQNYDDRQYQPHDAPANLGFQAADRHFPKSKLFSEMLMVETDHDMRNSADFISLDRVARALMRLHGVAMVQSMTRPLGRALEHASIPYLFTTQGSGNGHSCRSTGSRTPTPISRRISSSTLSRSCGKRSSSSRRCPMSCIRRHSPSRICKGSAKTYGTTYQILTISSVRSKAISFGRSTVSTYRSAGRSDRYSTRSTRSTTWPKTSTSPESLSRRSTRLSRKSSRS